LLPSQLHDRVGLLPVRPGRERPNSDQAAYPNSNQRALMIVRVAIC
jgi:hypothetical protein